jgi:hypothetical protein
VVEKGYGYDKSVYLFGKLKNTIGSDFVGFWESGNVMRISWVKMIVGLLEWRGSLKLFPCWVVGFNLKPHAYRTGTVSYMCP